MRRLENKFILTLETAERRGWGNDFRSEFLAKSPNSQTVPSHRDSSQFPHFPRPSDAGITISVIEGPSKGLAYEMKEPCITLGRIGGGADLEFDEPQASEIQCIVAARQNGVCLYDAVSTFGTYVNGQRIAAAELTHMSTFRVGSSLLLVKVHPNQLADTC